MVAGEPVLRVSRGAGGRSLDPHPNGRPEDLPVLHVLYESLVDAGEDAYFLPGLANSWTLTCDRLSVTFRLQEGVKFHDRYRLIGQVSWCPLRPRASSDRISHGRPREGFDSLDSAPWILLAPGLAVIVSVLALNLLGDALPDLFDLQLRA